MESLTKEQTASREKTLLIALLLSIWAPLATGIAVMMSHSTTQLADFIRRSVELFALFVSWWIFRYLARNKNLASGETIRMQRLAVYCVAGALCCSGVILMLLALSRLSDFQPGGNVYPGLAIGILGLATNLWFWKRYTGLNAAHYNPLIDAQRKLYRAKAFADFCVITALGCVAVYPTHIFTRYIDLLGSAALSAYLLWSGLSTARTAPATVATGHNGGASQTK